MSETGLNLSVQPGVSGAFLRDEPRFLEIRKRIAEYDRLKSRLAKVEYELLCCNDPQWLASLKIRCKRLKQDFRRELAKQAEIPEITGAEAAAVTQRGNPYVFRTSFGQQFSMPKIADYMRDRFFEPGVRHHRINPETAGYKQGYGTAATFLIWLESRKNKEVIRKLNIASFGEDAQGELYILAFDGQIHELVPR